MMFLLSTWVSWSSLSTVLTLKYTDQKTGMRDLKDKLGSSFGINSTMKDLEYGDAGNLGDLISQCVISQGMLASCKGLVETNIILSSLRQWGDDEERCNNGHKNKVQFEDSINFASE